MPRRRGGPRERGAHRTRELYAGSCRAGTRRGTARLVHLAVHGRGDTRRGPRGSLAFSDARGGTEWVPFEQLAALPWSAELVVFSGCSTAVAGPRFGHELVSVARAAAERGAATVLACLWPVGDEPASALMTAFYRELIVRCAIGPSICGWCSTTPAARFVPGSATLARGKMAGRTDGSTTSQPTTPGRRLLPSNRKSPRPSSGHHTFCSVTLSWERDTPASRDRGCARTRHARSAGPQPLAG